MKGNYEVAHQLSKENTMEILFYIIMALVGITSAFLMGCIMYALIGASVR